MRGARARRFDSVGVQTKVCRGLHVCAERSGQSLIGVAGGYTLQGRGDLSSVAIAVRSVGLPVEDGEQLIQSLLHPAKVAYMTPLNGVWVVTEVVVGQLLKSFDLLADKGVTANVGVEGSSGDGCCLGRSHRDLRDDGDGIIQALIAIEANEQRAIGFGLYCEKRRFVQ